jgi:hypothetical protein
MGIIKEIPVVLNNTTQDIDYEGDWQRGTRTIIWTLNFTVKGYIFGKINDSSHGVITHSITSILNKITAQDEVMFIMDQATGLGEYQIGEIVYQGYSAGTSTATAKVVLWENGNLHLTNINGNFVSNLPIRATSSSANYTFTSYTPLPQKFAQIDVYANQDPVVKVDDTEFRMDSSNTKITMDKINMPSIIITES